MEWYISPQGHDARGAGKQNSPARSIRWLSRTGALNEGDTIWFMNGVYSDAIPNRFLRNGMKLRAVTPGAAILHPTEGDHGLEITGKRNFEVHGLIIEADDVRLDGVKIREGARNVLLEDVIIRYAPQNGIQISENSSGVTLKRVQIRECGVSDPGNEAWRHAVYCQGDNLEVIDSVAERCGGGGFVVKGNSGMDEGPKNILISYSRVVDCARGISVTSCRNARIIGNYVENVRVAAYGVNYDGATASFVRNTGKRANVGLRIGTRAGDIEVRFNTFTNCEVGILEAMRKTDGKTTFEENDVDLNATPVFLREDKKKGKKQQRPGEGGEPAELPDNVEEDEDE